METAYPENQTKQLQRLMFSVYDSETYYLKAAETINSTEFRDLFKQYAYERQAIADELKKRLENAGEVYLREDNSFFGSLERAWHNFRSSSVQGSDQAILESCSISDQAVLNSYDDILQEFGQDNSDMKYFLEAQRYAINTSFQELDRQYLNLLNTDNLL